jgi:hypothetical protein
MRYWPPSNRIIALLTVIAAALVVFSGAAAIYGGVSENVLLRSTQFHPMQWCLTNPGSFARAYMKVERCVDVSIAKRWAQADQMLNVGTLITALTVGLVIGAVRRWKPIAD